jgi:hypothetical protein
MLATANATAVATGTADEARQGARTQRSSSLCPGASWSQITTWWRPSRPSETGATTVKLKPSEDQLHRSVAEFLDLALLPPAVWTTFPAGWGEFGLKTAVRLKNSGLKPGMPDIFVYDRHRVSSNRTYTKVVGLELKKPGEKPSAAQQLMFARLRDVGVAIHVCESINDVVRALSHEGIGLRITKWRDEQPAPRKRPRARISARPEDTGDADGTTPG